MLQHAVDAHTGQYLPDTFVQLIQVSKGEKISFRIPESIAVDPPIADLNSVSTPNENTPQILPPEC